MTRRDLTTMPSHNRRSLAGAATLLAFAAAANAQDPAEQARRDALEAALAEIQLEDSRVAAPRAPTVIPSSQAGLGSIGPFRLLDLSFDLLTAAGGSTEDDESLQSLQGGGHDPRKRGFTIQNAEMAIIGAIDPYFRAETNLIWFIDPIEGETVVELEEAFLTTTCLPYGLQLEVGQMFTEFGRINPNHPHSWDFIDQPFILSRVFGPDGIRAPGARLSWLAPLPWFAELHFGVQNANGEAMASFLANDEFFEERAIGGRAFEERGVRSFADMLYLTRIVQSWQPSDSTTIALGGSALFGPNASGPDTETRIYGADLIVRWNDGMGGRQAQEVVWQSEYVHRDYEAGEFTIEPDIAVPGDTLRDSGFYSQLTWRVAPTWKVGMRVERGTGSGDSWIEDAPDREADPFRCDRTRISPLLQWQATHFSRVRLQYNYDEADYLESGEAHSIWLGFEVALGFHPAHKF